MNNNKMGKKIKISWKQDQQYLHWEFQLESFLALSAESQLYQAQREEIDNQTYLQCTRVRNTIQVELNIISIKV